MTRMSLPPHAAALRGGDALPAALPPPGGTSWNWASAFQEHDSACLACFRRAYREAGWEPGAAKASGPAASLLAGLLAAEVLAPGRGHQPTRVASALSRLTPADAAMSRYMVGPNADCPECGWR